ncbi:hypothetical protein HU200_053784 [Digitaria exilis]|uniref:Uncharacterized protein n=1 Tax=Digitaria exilis TaxID=1010633 RepID=A0A835E4N7_9POAL|nr:hypothetical protein HU200_053784 [Digitaria exilis]CAB3483964.1 unnamed protein product [Digitaria exilis]
MSLVTKSLPFLVAPSEATPAGTVRLTSMDSALASLPMAAVFVFEHPIDQPAETIRRALSRALVPYYPIAGRLTVGEHGPRIACTCEGVAFVAASARCTLHDARLTDRRPAIPAEDLTVTYAGQYNQKDSPLLLMQVTEFSCGGFVVGVTWNHVITDGVGMAQFLQAVGGFARGFSSPSTVEPVRVDCALPEFPPPIIAMTKEMVSRKHNEFPNSYITIPMSFINRIKDEFRRSSGQVGGDHNASCTAFDVFTAAIWKCRARATVACGTANKDAPTAFVFTANVRKQAGAKDGYYGNVFTFGLAVSTVGAVANGDILDLVRLIRDAKARVPYTFADGAANIADEMGGRLQGLDGYNTLYVTSWWNLGLDDVDFGSGGPACIMGNMERKVVPACILCGRKDKADGVAAMAFCVKQEHAEAFHSELGMLR